MISAAVSLTALFGIAVLNGVVLVSTIGGGDLNPLETVTEAEQT